MRESERVLRDLKLAKAFADGARICELAERFDLKRLQVARILKRIGAYVRDEDETHVAPMWSMDEDRRRYEFWRRAQEAAHAARFRQLQEADSP